MDLFQEEFDKLVRPKAKMPRFRIHNLTRRLSEHPFVLDEDESHEEESMMVFWIRLIRKIVQMMYVSGETAEPSHETTGMVEEIVRQQVIEMVCGTSIYSFRIIPWCNTANKPVQKCHRRSVPRQRVDGRLDMLIYNSCVPAQKMLPDVVANP